MNQHDTEQNGADSNENQLMEKYGIACSTKSIYHYREYRYERLKDALAYAEIDRKRNLATSGDNNTHAVKKPGQ